MESIVNIKPADAGMYKHHYKPITVGSIDFGELLPVRYLESEKKDHWQSVVGKGIVRVAPSDFPAYGRLFLRQAAFFVPYIQIQDNYESIRANQSLFKGRGNYVPHFTNGRINYLLYDNKFSTSVASKTAAEKETFPAENTYDFIFVTKTGDDTAVYNFRLLNSLGKRYYKLFKSLGYDFHGYIFDSSYETVNSTGLFDVNAYSLLAYAKVYCDYFMNVHFYNSSILVAMMEALRHGEIYINGGVDYVYSNGDITKDGLRLILDSILLPIENNMYTDAWNSQNSPTGVVQEGSVNPDGPISLVIPNSNIPSRSLAVNTISNTVESVRLHNDRNLLTVDYLSGLTQYGLNTLSAIYAFVKRNNLSGSEAAKEIFNRTGIKGIDFENSIVFKLYENSTDIDFSAVISNSNTVSGDDGSVLGAYAGYADAPINFDYNYKVSDYGIVLNLCWLQIAPLMLHGFDPMVMRKHPFDWHTAEFDGKASRAIPISECMYTNKLRTGALDIQVNDSTIFGFTDLYEEYRHQRDMVLGDFVIGHAKNFVFGRNLGYFRGTIRESPKPQTAAIQYFNREGQSPDLTDVFTYKVQDGDRFDFQINWDIVAERPIKTKADALDLNGSGDLEVNVSGNQTT